MAAADGILRELFVRLGFKIDTNSEKNFQSSLLKASLGANLLGTAFEQAAEVVGKAIANMALGFERLAYTSQRTHTSVKDIRAFAYAVSQLGGSHNEALQSMEQFYKNIRDNRGYEGLLHAMGIRTRNAQGQLRGFVEISKELGNFFRRYPRDVAHQYALRLGIDDQTFRLLRESPELLENYARAYQRTQESIGVDNEKLAQQGTALSVAWRRFLATLSAVSDRIMSTFMPVFTRLLNFISDWVDAHGPQIDFFWTQVGKGLEVVERGAKAAYAAIEPFITMLTDKISDMQKDGTFISVLEKMANAFERVVSAVKQAIEWIKEFERLTDTSEGLRIIGRLLGWVESKTSTAMDIPGVGRTLASVDAATDAGVGHTGGGGGSIWERGKNWVKEKLGLGGGSGTVTDTAGAPPVNRLGRAGRLGNVNAIIDELRKAGYNNNAIAAIIGSMEKESSFNPAARNSKGFTGLWQWDPVVRWPKIAKWIKDQGGNPWDPRWQAKALVAEHDAKPGDPLYDTRRTSNAGRIWRSDPTMDQAIFGVYESERFNWGKGEEAGRGRAAKAWLPYVQNPRTDVPMSNPVGQATNVSDDKVREMDWGHWKRVSDKLGKYDFAAMRGARETPLGTGTVNNNAVSNAVTLHSKTEINVMGGSDPTATASEVAKQQNHVNDMSLRQAQGAVR
jgi:hypothetical protein